jgi:hypothetical protein
MSPRFTNRWPAFIIFKSPHPRPSGIILTTTPQITWFLSLLGPLVTIQLVLVFGSCILSRQICLFHTTTVPGKDDNFVRLTTLAYRKSRPLFTPQCCFSKILYFLSGRANNHMPTLKSYRRRDLCSCSISIQSIKLEVGMRQDQEGLKM